MDEWILTYSGIEFNVFNPSKEDINIIDIAHGLALKCRFNGQCDDFYSVAEHSVRMVRWNLPGPPLLKLMHDAAEAYLPDIPTPIKLKLANFQEIEHNLLKIIFEKFNIPLYNKDEIQEADQIMLATEARDLMGNPTDWELTYPPYQGEIIVPWRWKNAEYSFLMQAKELNIV